MEDANVESADPEISAIARAAVQRMVLIGETFELLSRNDRDVAKQLARITT